MPKYTDLVDDPRDRCEQYKNDSIDGLLGCDRRAGHDGDDHYDAKKNRRF